MSRLSVTKMGRWRIEKGFHTAQDGADVVRCSRLHLLAIEEGRKAPSDELLEKLVKIYGQPKDGLKRAIRRARLDFLARATKKVESS